MKRSGMILLVVPFVFACSEPLSPGDSLAPQYNSGKGGGNGKEGGGKDKDGGSTTSDPTPTWTINTFAAFGLRGDGGGPYVHGQCSVSTRIFSGGSGDATIQTDQAKGKGCGRTFTVVYPDGVTESVRSFNNLRDVASIEVGAVETRSFVVNPGTLARNPSRCGRLIFGPIPGSAGSSGSDPVTVTRVDARTWVVKGVEGRAYCENEDRVFSTMSVHLEIAIP